MWAAIGNALKNLAIKKAKKTAVSAAAGDESSQKKILIVVIVAISIFLIIIVSIVATIFGPIMIGREYIEQFKNSTGVLFEKVGNVLALKGWCSESDGSCSKLAEQEFYEELNSVYQSYSNRSITIDDQLITATIFYGYAKEDNIYQEDEDGFNQRFIDNYCEANAIGWAENIGCPQYVKMNYDNVYNKYFNKYVSISYNYETLNKIHCSHDTLFEKLNSLNPGIKITQSTTEEACQFYLWNYADLSSVRADGSYIIYRDGKNDIKKLAQEMVKGNRINLSSYREYLIDKYIPENFSSLIDESDREKSIERIADEIMLFASVKDNSGSSNFASLGTNCQSITLREGNGQVVVHDLEEYVAGVVSAENEYGIESSKMQAVAARTVAVSRCDEIIDNSTNVQKYTTPTESGKSAAEATEGLVLAYDGKVLDKNNVAFASYPKAYYSGGFPGYEQKGAKCGAVNCSTGSDGRQWCETTIYKLPDLEAYNLKMPNTTPTGDYWNGLSLNNQAGHCYGMSQVASRYYESELNYTYEQMIKIFFSDGVEIVSIQGFGTGLISGGQYVSNAPMYTDASWLGHVNYEYYQPVSVIGKNYGECPWYAKGRAIEILAYSNMSEELKQTAINSLRNTLGNGADWFVNPSGEIFSKSTDLYAAKPGAIVSWSGGGAGYGHVGIIEDVEYDSNGKATKVLLTDGWNGTGNPSNAQYSYRWMDIEHLRIYNASRPNLYRFNGYVYLLD